MRLIDADKLKCIYPVDKEWHKVLNHAKTIKAIPISVIEDIKAEIATDLTNAEEEGQYTLNDLDSGICIGLQMALDTVEKYMGDIK